MQVKKSCCPTQAVFTIFLTFLLVSAVAIQPAQAKTKFKVLHTFHGKDGAFPGGQLVRDVAGNIYGTTGSGGNPTCQQDQQGCGTVFKLSKNGKQVWIHSFDGKNGWGPAAGVLRDTAGNLYGTTIYGGKVITKNNLCGLGCGTVFKLDKTGKKESVLHRFKGYADGYNPEALLTRDPTGNIYGTTISGGFESNGVVFKVDQAGAESVLYTFKGGADGGSDYPGLIWGPGSLLYGVAGWGAFGDGVVFDLDTAGNETVLHSFSGGDGGGPSSILIADAAGNLYGTTQGGGNRECGGTGCGVVFELSPNSDGSWTETVLYVFCSLTNCTDGEDPLSGPLVRDATGNLYGTTYFGGAYNDGTIFKLDSTGKETVVHNFTGNKDGALPWAGLTMDAAGTLYGTAEIGGDLGCEPRFGGCGVVFRITR
jgi:uncharacterized repeat protein (TIGR03803 family)